MRLLLIGIALFSFSHCVEAKEVSDTNKANDTIEIPEEQIVSIGCLYPTYFYQGPDEWSGPRVINNYRDFKDFFASSCPDTLNIDFDKQTLLYFPKTWGGGGKVTKRVQIIGSKYIYTLSIAPSGLAILFHGTNIIAIPKIKEGATVQFVFQCPNEFNK